MAKGLQLLSLITEDQLQQHHIVLELDIIK
jgi:hypothetical protein